MRWTGALVAVLLFSVAACDAQDAGPEEPDRPVATTSTVVGTTSTTSSSREVFSRGDEPEVVFVGPLADSEGTLVIRYAPNSMYRDSGEARLPTVGDLRWFLDVGAGCAEVDRATFIEEARGSVILTPAPGGDISIGESLPLWVEGDWLIHDGCSRGDRIVAGAG